MITSHIDEAITIINFLTTEKLHMEYVYANASNFQTFPHDFGVP